MDNFIIFLVVVAMPVGPFILAIMVGYFYHQFPAFAAWHDRYLGGD